MEACDSYIRKREYFEYKRAGISDSYSNKMEICMAMHANTCIVLYVSVFGGILGGFWNSYMVKYLA